MKKRVLIRFTFFCFSCKIEKNGKKLKKKGDSNAYDAFGGTAFVILIIIL